MKLILSATLSLFLLCSCAPTVNYETLRSSMSKGNCPGSVQMVKNSKDLYGNKAQLLYLLDSGMINLQCTNLKKAGKFFLDADEMAQELWTKSLSAEAASYVTNDLIIPYSGEDFERALINLFSAFTYIQKGEYDEAMTDCRRLDTLLTEYNNKYKNKNVYSEDAFGRYISGILSEADREYDEAYIYYYEAFHAFNKYNTAYGTVTPVSLFEDLLRTSYPADKVREARRLVPNYKSIKYVPHKKSRRMGKIVLIHLNGMGPKKIENKYTITTSTGPISIAFPKYVTSPPGCHSSTLVLKSASQTFEEQAVLVEDINKIAVKGLADRKVRVTAKAIARAVAKQAIVRASAKEIEKEHGALAGLAAQIAGQVVASATEQADTRSWRTLPGEIYLARKFVPAGDYQVSVENCNGTMKQFDKITVKSGETKFVFYDSIY